MKDVIFHTACEARFVHAPGDEPKPLNDIARQARKIASGEIPDADKDYSVWKVPRGAEMSIPDRDVEKLGQLVGNAGEPLREEEPTNYVEDTTDGKTRREQVEQKMAEGGFSPEGKIIDDEKHKIWASQEASRSANQPLPQQQNEQR